MSQSITSTRFLKDFEGRRVTACAIFVAAFGSAALNVWGATQIFPDWKVGMIFAAVVSAGEVIAFLALRSIMKDRENNCFWKSRLGALILALAIAGCIISGHRAFHTLSLEASANHGALVIRAEAAQKEADKYLATLLSDDTGVIRARWESRQDRADAAKLRVMKSEPLPASITYVFLALFEIIKIGGLWALATPSTKGLTKAQRKSLKRRAKITEAKANADFERKLAEVSDADDSNVIPMAAKA